MTDRERLTALLMAGAGDCLGKGGALNCSKLADYLLEHSVIVLPETGIGDISDGYHTFNELYHHRAVLFSVICNTFKDKAWKSKKHDTGDMYDGMFIVGIETPQGQATYHYDINPYWSMFKVKELPNAPKWDGHTPEEAIKRISMLQVDNVIVPPCKVGDTVWLIKNVLNGEKVVRVIAHRMIDGIGGNRLNPIWLISKYPYELRFCPSEFGKTVFLTREEAEQALKECKDNG